MAGRFCQECGAANEAIAKYCATCGSELRAGIPPASTPAVAAPPDAPPVAAAPPPYAPYPNAPGYAPGYGIPYPPAYGPPYPFAGPYPAYPNFAEIERTKQVDRTKTGLLLLAVGFLIGWIPLVGPIGALLSFIGAILVILGRQAFGARHSNFVILSVILYITSIVLVGAFIIWFAIATFQMFSRGNARPLLSVFWPFLGGVIGASALGAVAEVLFVHELEKPIGRYILYAALIAAIAVPLATVLVLLPAITAALDGIASGTITNPNDGRLAVLLNVSETLGLLSVVADVLFGLGYFLAWQRIERREIPAVTAPAGVPSPSPFPSAPPGAAPPPPSAPPP